MTPTDLIALPAIALSVLAVVVLLLLLVRRRTSTTDIHVSLEKIKEMNELTVMTAYIKEVVTMRTQEGNWFSTTGKIILICPYEIEFRYNLRRTKISTTGGKTTVVLPPHYIKAIPGKVQFYDEKKAAYLNVWPVDFTPEERNKLINEAAAEAIKQAGILQGDLQEKVQASAKTTLMALAHAFGTNDLRFVFEGSDSVVQQLAAQQWINAQGKDQLAHTG
ncbi:DUF4230 domain-containing protein [Niveibacterium sp. SC-1]|uniref:DUF4230 domain-containing protein n=1 Tax=Niveibacterium sp. SC-1 TaxID=3135646 RepID=UPI00311E83CE